MRRGWIALIALPVLVSCFQAGGEPSPTQEPGSFQEPEATPEPTPPGAPGAPGARSYRTNWNAIPDGKAPADFVDVRKDGHQYDWLYDGGWRVSRQGGTAVLEVPFSLQEPQEPLSFRRYSGTAFGPDGALPPRYRIDAEARSLGGSTRFRGYGELAIQVYYQNPTRYVEVLQTDEHVLLWEADDAPPMQGKGWKQLAKVSNPVKIGDWVRFGASVDRKTGEVTAFLNGKPVAQGTSEVVKEKGPAKFTIRATGNKEEWRWVEVREIR